MPLSVSKDSAFMHGGLYRAIENPFAPLPNKFVWVYQFGTIVYREVDGTYMDDTRHVHKAGKNRLNTGVSDW